MTDRPDDHPAPPRDEERGSRHARYWRRNRTIVFILLVIWAIPSFGFSIFGVETLNQIQIGGFPLGFWFAQQGSIYIFIVLIFIYAKLMERLDKKYREGDV